MFRNYGAVINIILVLFFLLGLYFVCRENFFKKADPVPNPNSIPAHNLPVEQNTAPSDKKADRIDRNGTLETIRIEQPSKSLQPADSVSVNLEEHSMSLKKPNRDIAVTPGVVFQPGEGISLKISNKEETVRIKRDNTYRPGEYKVLLERKY